MNDVLQHLAERIRLEILDLDQVVARALDAWSFVDTTSTEQHFFIDSVALNLHSFYSGLERLFELTARHVDENVPEGVSWHRDLLVQMSQNITDLRPALITPENGKILDEFRRFRHLVRNVYTVDLDPDKMAGLLTHLPKLWPKLKAELLAFADYLTALHRSTSQS